MANENKKRLMEFLASQENWVKALEIGAYLGISERMVRKYIKLINEESGHSILSSHLGYKLATALVLPKKRKRS
ncbi:transcription antiterminator [Listeria floridensis FSL S10-1187]|uniref:Transcription antiterminator n=1 Tax=Listeria floridensis FSL S10-1187 TaxID=1265817 RepID=A0ABN0RIA7_9LIST|nr:HTH domain-containing protein [Listeria floridensis]EUJ33736.1 transcription antiterminator [Listeria floridensis FSL S10-1187]